MSFPSVSRKSRITSAANVLYNNAVYWPNHSVYRGDTPGSLNYGCINRVYYGFANIMPDGGVFVSLFRRHLPLLTFSADMFP